jgi:hypothetical protein
MKKRIGDRVAAYAAFPNKGAFYSGATGTVISNYWCDKDGVMEEFRTVKLDGSGDYVPAHDKQLRLLVKICPKCSGNRIVNGAVDILDCYWIECRRCNGTGKVGQITKSRRKNDKT